MPATDSRLRRHLVRLLARLGFVPADQVSRTRQLAARVATLAHALDGPQRDAPPGADADAIALLEVACRLLERQAQAPVVPTEPRPAPPAAASPTVAELIRLRDIVLAAADGAGGAAVPPAVMQALYHKLGRILEHEGVVAIEDTGAFDADRQEAVETLATDDPARDEQVCATVRPGYLFQGRVLRPQQVTVYTLRR